MRDCGVGVIPYLEKENVSDIVFSINISTYEAEIECLIKYSLQSVNRQINCGNIYLIHTSVSL